MTDFRKLIVEFLDDISSLYPRAKSIKNTKYSDYNIYTEIKKIENKSVDDIDLFFDIPVSAIFLRSSEDNQNCIIDHLKKIYFSISEINIDNLSKIQKPLECKTINIQNIANIANMLGSVGSNSTSSTGGIDLSMLQTLSSLVDTNTITAISNIVKTQQEKSKDIKSSEDLVNSIKEMVNSEDFTQIAVSLYDTMKVNEKR